MSMRLVSGRKWSQIGLVTIFIDALHEEIGDPEGGEQVTGAHLFLAVVFPDVQELKDIRVPRLHVYCQAALAFAAALINVA